MATLPNIYHTVFDRHNFNSPIFDIGFVARHGHNEGSFYTLLRRKVVYIQGQLNNNNKHVKPYRHKISGNFFQKWPKTATFLITKMPPNWSYEAQILYVSKCSSNEHVKLNWWESNRNSLPKELKILISTYLGAKMTCKFGTIRPFFHTPPKVAATILLIKFNVNPMGFYFHKIVENIHFQSFLSNFYPFRGPNGPKFGPLGRLFYALQNIASMSI